MKVKTADLIGPALDWAVAKCEGLNPNSDPKVRRQYVGYSGFAEVNGFGYAIKHYSTDWSQGGPIIDSGKINIKSNLARMPEHPEYDWLSDCPEKGLCVSFNGPTPLIAAMRCYVASQLGDEVYVPDELMKQT